MKTHELSVEGKYYVVTDNCAWCGSCELEAPKNFKIPENYNEGAYVYKQPETAEEEQQCKSAKDCCPHLAILDNGDK